MLSLKEFNSAVEWLNACAADSSINLLSNHTANTPENQHMGIKYAGNPHDPYVVFWEYRLDQALGFYWGSSAEGTIRAIMRRKGIAIEEYTETHQCPSRTKQEAEAYDSGVKGDE